MDLGVGGAGKVFKVEDFGALGSSEFGFMVYAFRVKSLLFGRASVSC